MVHTDTREAEGYVLLGAKKAPRLNAASGTQRDVRMNSPQPGRFVYEVNGGSMSDLTELLSDLLRLPVLDKTGLAGTYDYTLTLDLSGGGSEPAIPIAIEKQLGLRMERQRVMVDTLVIDRAEMLAEDGTERVLRKKK
jgi:uncharacterized protein (TIGR03435 family)